MSIPRSTIRNSLVLLAGLASLGTAVYVLDTANDSPTAADSSDGLKGSRRGRSHAAASLADGPCAFALGTTMAYDVETSTHSVIDMSGLMNQVNIDGSGPMQVEATAMDQEASRDWHVDLTAVAHAEDGSTVLSASIDAGPTRIQGAGQQLPAVALADTFLVRVDPQCSIREFAWRTGGDLDAAREQQGLLASLAYLAPERGEHAYGGMLFDVVGRYFAQYAVEAEGRITGHAVEYRKPFGRVIGEMMPTMDVVRSAITVVPTEGQWFAELDHERTVSMELMGETLGRLDSSVHAVAGKPAEVEPEVDVADGGWSWGLLLGQPRKAGSRGNAKRAALVGVAMQAAVAGYQKTISERGFSIDAVPELVAWLQANPEGAQEILAHLRAGGFDGPGGGAPGVFLALSTAGTDQATTALLDIIGGDDDLLGHKVSAAHALANVEAPTETMIDAVVAGADGASDSVTRGSMAMGLGSFAHRNADRAPELAELARGEITQWLDAPADNAELAGSLLAAGNAGHDGLAVAIDPYFDHEDPEIRQRAAHAMRHMSPDEAFPRLASGMNDDNPAVRASAAETALSVSLSRGAPVPDSIVETAIEQLDLGSPDRGQKALLGLLGEAAKYGNEGADAVLQQHFLDELESGMTDLDKFRALGEHTGTHWSAD